MAKAELEDEGRILKSKLDAVENEALTMNPLAAYLFPMSLYDACACCGSPLYVHCVVPSTMLL